MKEIIHNKLVRDDIPKIVAAGGARPVVRRLNSDEYKLSLLHKLVEEAGELLESGGSLDERADVAEVLVALDKAFGLSADEIEIARMSKAQARGSFTEAFFLEKVIFEDEG